MSPLLRSIVEQQAIALHALREHKDVVTGEVQSVTIDDDSDDEVEQSSVWGRGDKADKDSEVCGCYPLVFCLQ